MLCRQPQNAMPIYSQWRKSPFGKRIYIARLFAKNERTNPRSFVHICTLYIYTSSLEECVNIVIEHTHVKSFLHRTSYTYIIKWVCIWMCVFVCACFGRILSFQLTERGGFKSLITLSFIIDGNTLEKKLQYLTKFYNPFHFHF